VVSENDCVNSAMSSECVYIGEQAIEKVAAQSRSLSFIETKARDEISLRVWEDFNRHEVWRRISALALSQSTNLASPDAI
jgi:hypothetical protein